MPLAHYPLVHDLELAVKGRFRESLPPRALRGDELGVPNREIRAGELAVGHDDAGEIPFADARRHGVVEGVAESGQVVAPQRETRRRGVAAELAHEAGMQGRAVGDGVANVQPRNGAGGPLEVVWRGGAGVREGDHRAVVALPHPPGDDADHALVPMPLVEAQGFRVAGVADLHQRHGVLVHTGLDLPAPRVQFVEPAGVTPRFGQIGRQQTADADAHVFQPPGGVEPRRDGEAEIRRRELGRVALGDFQQRLHAGTQRAGAHPPQPLMNQNAVVPIQRNDIGDRADGDQIQPIRQMGHGDAARLEVPVRAEYLAHGAQHIVGDADAGQIAACELRIRQVGIHQCVRLRQIVAGQMVIGDDDVHPGRLRERHAFHAGRAVVHRDDDVWLLPQQHARERGRQAVAVLETVGDAIVHPRGAEGAQQGDTEGGSRRAVGVEVAGDEDVFVAGHCRRQPLGRGCDARQSRRRDQGR